MSKGKTKKKAKSKGGGGSSSGGGADTLSSTGSSDTFSVTPYFPLESSHSSLSVSGKEAGSGRSGDKDKERKDASHNSEACLFTKDKDGGAAAEVSWGKLSSRKLEKFLADVNAKGTITIPLDEVKQEIDMVMCQSCHIKLQDTLHSCLQSPQSTVICSSIKMQSDSGEGSAMTIVSPLSTAQIPSLKDMILSASSSKTDEELEEGVTTLVAEQKKKLRLSPGDSLAHPVSSLGLQMSLSFPELVATTEESAKRARDIAGPLKAKLPLADHEDSSPRGFVEWGTPRHNVSHLVQGMDSHLTRWIEHLTKLVIKISRLQPYALFLASAGSRDRVRVVVESAWSAYEKGMEEILDFSIKARQDQMRETNMPGIFGICLATKSNTQKIKSMLKKKSFLDEMHEGVMQYCREGTEDRMLLNELARFARVSDDYFTTEEWQHLDSLEDEILNVRTQLVQENTTFNFVGRGELVQHDQHLENQLKKLLNDWENALDKIQPVLVESAQYKLSPSVYPQTKAMSQEFKLKESEFKQEWESLKDTYQLKAKMSQNEVSALNTQAHVQKQKIKVMRTR